MKQYKFFLATIFAIVFMGLQLHAEVVQSIEIEGLKKTRPSTIQNIIGYKVGDPISQDSEEDIRQKLVKSGLFINETIEVQLQFTDEGAVIHLFLNDRVTLIPIPVVSYSSDGLSGGLFVAESNFLGFGHQLFLGGIYSAKEQFAILGYTNPSFMGSDFSVSSSMGFFNNETTVVSVDGDTDLAVYDITSTKLGLSTSWNLSPFEIGLGASAFYISTDLSDEDFLQFQPDVQLQYDTLYYDTYFTEGINSRISYSLSTFTGTFDFTQSLQTSLSSQLILSERWQLQLNGDAGISRGDDLQSLSLGTGFCGSILPSDVLADHFMQANIKIQYAAFDFSWGYLAIPLAYQAGVLDGISGDKEFFHGPSTGLVLYLKKVAIPAMAIQYARNMETGRGESSFNLGVQI